MCESCRELRAQIRDLERDLGLRHAVDVRYAVARGLKITPGAATIVARLYAARNGHVTTGQLMDATAPVGLDDDRDPKNVSVRIWQIRKALGRDSILTLHGKGYRLTEQGVARVEAVLLADRQGVAA